MAVKLRRPILVGGVGLSFALWLWQSWHQSLFQLGEIGLLSTIAIGGGLWLLNRQTTAITPSSSEAVAVNRETAAQAIAQAEAVVNQLTAEAENLAGSELLQQVTQLTAELDRQEIRIAITGGKAVGKTTLLQVLATSWMPQMPQQLKLSETPALFTATTDNALAATLATAIASDLVLFVTTGDLTESELQAWQQLTAANQQTVLVLNKQDQYLPEDRATVLTTLQQRISSYPQAVVATAAVPSWLKVRQHQLDGAVQEWQEQRQPEITQLTQQLTQTINQVGQQLVWATTRRAALALKTAAQTELNHIRRDRALPIVEQYQWIAAAAAFANPVPALDLLATAAINAQMVMDLGNIYQQQFSLQQAQATAGTVGKLMLKLGLVELSTKTITTILKSNAVTFVAGGVVQGVSAAYLTRLAGLSLIEYFQTQAAETSSTALNLDKLSQTIQKVFQQHQQLAFLPGFVKQGWSRLLPESPQPQLTDA